MAKELKIKIQPEVVVVTLGIILVIFITWFFIMWRSAESSKEEAIETAESLIKEKAAVFAVEKQRHQNDSIRSEAKQDSAHRVYEALEKLRKSDYYYFQNQLNELKKVNTYSARKRYLDSLERANGLR